MPVIKRIVQHNSAGRVIGGSSYDIFNAQEVIVYHMKRGVRFAAACELAGISKATGYYWLALGEGRVEGEEPTDRHVNFVKEIREAEATLEAELVQVWKASAMRDWRAAREFLSRRFGKTWGRYATQAETNYPEPTDRRAGSGGDNDSEVIEMRDYSWQASWHAKVAARLEAQERALEALREAEEKQNEQKAIAAQAGATEAVEVQEETTAEEVQEGESAKQAEQD